ncbi:MarR family winged helix-turn-helix transcriptional regulator [Thermobrachium celere]|uniref:Transcriptional regulator, MarR family n=1 Tax=Thermobrachium celere DSM 8682 TaxID=941824 RepID=R7RTK3_9CLOT|nr:MarR family transcriptional regulator [Thermobrachium celere]GFR36058.1 MarR family transcriptional regulator [Thermobrachium celere]CDF58741.1 Transcriptional regulator, MarR family [Thermobrachium celere DSM 8682]
MDFCNIEGVYQSFIKVIKVHHQYLHIILEKLDLYPGQPPLLFTLYKNDGLSQREIADKLHIKPATITVMLTRMEKAGLITRRQDEEDQRISRVYLTQKGREMCEELKKVMADLNEKCFGNFTEDEREIFKKLLEKMAENIEKAKDK